MVPSTSTAECSADLNGEITMHNETMMQNMEQMNSEIELTDAELDAINGGSFFGAIGHALSWVAHKVKDALGDGARF
jgi:hypothetical protein